MAPASPLTGSIMCSVGVGVRGAAVAVVRVAVDGVGAR